MKFVELQKISVSSTGAVQSRTVLPNYTDLTFDVMWSVAPSTITFGYPLNEANALGLKAGSIVSPLPDGEDRELWFILESTSGVLVTDSGFVRSFSGRSFSAILEDDVVLSSAWPNPVPADHSFQDATPGTVVRTLMARSHERGFMTMLQPEGFTGSVDSNGAGWPFIRDYSFSAGSSVLQAIQELEDGGDAEFTFRSGALRAYKPGSTQRHLSPSVVTFRGGQSLQEHTQDSDASVVATDVVVVGEEGASVHVFDEPARNALGRRRTRFVTHSGISDIPTLGILAQAELDGVKHIPVEENISVPHQDPSMSQPFKSYRPGDWVWLENDSGELTEIQIQQISVSVGTDGVTVGVALGSLLSSAMEKLKRRIDAIIGGNGSRRGPVPVPPRNRLAPAAPSLPAVATEAYTLDNGFIRAQVVVSWPPVTTNVDGTPTDDVTYYEVYFRPHEDPPLPWQLLGKSEGEPVYYSDLPPKVAYQFQVFAYDVDGLKSPGSPIRAIFTASDDTPPPIPSAPVLTTRLGVISVFWDGLGFLGQEMPLDFDHIEISMTTETKVNPVNADVIARIFEGSGTEYVTDQPHGQLRFFRFRSVDYARNKSEWSEEREIATKALVDEEEIEQEIIEQIEESRVRIIEIFELVPPDIRDVLGELEDNWTDADDRIKYLTEDYIPGQVVQITEYVDDQISGVQGDIADSAAELGNRLSTAEQDIDAAEGRLEGAETRLGVAEGEIADASAWIDGTGEQLGTNLAAARADLDAAFPTGAFDVRRLIDLAASDATSANLIPDGDFELGIAVDNNIVEDATAFSGTHMLRFSLANYDNCYMPWTPAVPGMIVAMSAYARKVGSGAPGSFQLAVRVEHQDGSQSSLFSGDITDHASASTTWKRYESPRTITIPETAVRMRGYVVSQAGSGTGSLDVDLVAAYDVTSLVAAQEAIATADAAMTAANGKNLMTYSNISEANKPGPAPTETAGRVAGDVHRNRNQNTGEVYAEWMLGANGTWQTANFGDSILRSLDVGKITGGSASFVDFVSQNLTSNQAIVNDLWTKVVRSQKITTDMLLVGSGVNLVPNGNIALGLEGWSDNWTLNTVNAKSIGYPGSIWLEGTQIGQGEWFPVEGGKDYRVTVWVRSDRAGKTFTMQLLHDGVGAVYPFSATPTMNGAYQEHVASVTMPADATTARVQVYANHGSGSTTDGFQWFTGFHMTEDIASLIVDGGITAKQITITGDENNPDEAGLVANIASIMNLDVENLTATGTSTLKTAVIDNLWTNVVRANKITADMLLVGSGVNLIVDPGFKDPDLTAYRASLSVGQWSEIGVSPHGGTNRFRLYNASSGVETLELRQDINGTFFPIDPGETYRLRFRAVRNTGTATIRAAVRFRRADGSLGYQAADNYAAIETDLTKITSAWHEMTWKSPVDAIEASMTVQVQGTAGFVDVVSPSFTVSGASLIVDGTIAANAIATNAIETKHISADAVVANHIKAGAIDADHISTNAITARALAVQPMNAFPDPYFWDFPAWATVAGINIQNDSAAPGGRRFTFQTTSATSVHSYYNGPGYRGVQLEPGATYRLRFTGRRGGSSPHHTMLRLYLRGENAAGSTITSYTNLENTPTSFSFGEYVEYDIAVPTTFQGGMTVGFMRVGGPFTSSNYQIADVSLLRKNGGTLIEDGAITTDKIFANAITAGKIAADAIEANHIKAAAINATHIKTGSIYADALAIGHQANLLPGADEVGNTAKSPAELGWSGFGRNANDPSFWLQGRKTNRTDAPFFLKAGTKYKVSVDVKASVNATRFYWQFVAQSGQNLGGTYVFSNEVVLFANRWQTFETEFTTPESGLVILNVYANHQNGADNESGYQWFRNMSVTSMTPGVLIEDGTITGDRLVANAITAREIKALSIETGHLKANVITAAKIDAGAIEAIHIKANAIEADKIKADALDGKVITGATLRTKTSPTTGGGQWTSSTFRMWDTSGNLRVNFYPAANTFNINGIFTASNSNGQGVELRPPSGGIGGWLDFVDPTMTTEAYIATGGSSAAATERGTLTMVSASTVTNSRRGRLRLEPGGGVVLGSAGTGTGTSDRQVLNMQPNSHIQFFNVDPNVGIQMGTEGVTGVQMQGNGTTQFWVRGDRITANGIYTNTATGTANVAIYSNNSGELRRVTSLRAFKDDIQPLSDSAGLAFLDLEPVTWLDKGEVARGEAKYRHMGFIAEQVAELEDRYGVEGLTVRDENGALTSVAYDRLLGLAVSAVRELDKRVKELENK